MSTTAAIQATFEDLGTALADVTFVVLDLETTGGSATDSRITEIGAVKVRAGERLEEFQTLINPAESIPAFISVLTGITDRMVASAPRIESALPAFLEFIGDSVLVAHNAGFDITFLKVNAARLGLPWPGNKVLDTVHLARQLVGRDESPNHKLSSLAQLFHAVTTPDHRALHDARATVDVLHGLLERVGNLGVHTLEELQSYSARVSPGQRRKRFLADPLPSAPGVYIFKDDHQRPLYIGTSVNIKRRVRTYFTAAEQRSRMAEMVGLAASVTPIVCQTTLEAQVRELRLIAEHKPRYNRRSRHPERAVWLKLTAEAFPRLSIVREVRCDHATYAGPFGSRVAAEAAMAAVHEVLPLRQCTKRLSTRTTSSACALAEMGRCGAPCTGAQSVDDYALIARSAAQTLDGSGRGVLDALDERLRDLAAGERFEDASLVRDRMIALVRAAARAQRIRPLADSAEIIAAAPRPTGGWEFTCVRWGRFAGATVAPRGADPRPFIEALRASAETVAEPQSPAPAASAEETEKILTWLDQPGVRVVDIDGVWTCPVDGAGQAQDVLEPLLRSQRDVAGFSEASDWSVASRAG
ncbi:DEDD exonuclease domain-containing protein [Rudaeicoccus suwonensis]|uniref:DNA polymerase-3 subunit epsilon n=1 Tax=Rudaeicoccus suwonensis TaxID=657409 RepID=A0A561EBP4_9MICO|nr:DEDD exonuclease domain-containing protein [Rudaeicoccus suwonensis]TWE13017.1 DNA polymerase-3 subunit epsilon [Rudaeicoccus suwonensis]